MDFAESSSSSSNSSDEIFIKNGKLKCSHCDKTFLKKEYLEKHMKKSCKMLINFNNIYDFKQCKLAKDIYKNKEAGEIYIIQTDYLNYNYFKIGISTNLESRITQYRCGNTYEPRLYYYIPCRNVRGIDNELNIGLSQFNVKREIFTGDIEIIKNKIVSIVQSKYPNDNVVAYEPEIKLGDFTECVHCKKCFFNSISLSKHFAECEEYRESLNKFNTTNTHICKYCHILFARNSSLQRHINNRCKIRNGELQKCEMQKDELQKKNDALVIHIEKLINEIAIFETNNINNTIK
jgi:hypothetical protein|uniref:C2H2-type domain-containing protein n=1 Tax=viral metagenome TaxID=1070528 RepID=A0A6C0IXK6_9ZZZZ